MAPIMPDNGGNAVTDYWQTCQHSGLFDQSRRGKIELTGPDAVSFLHNLCTNDIQSLQTGQGCEAFLTTTKAKVLAFAHIFRLPREENEKMLWLDVDPGQSTAVIQHLNKYLISEQVEITDRTGEFSQFHLAGPDAKRVLTRLMGGDVSSVENLQSKCSVPFIHRVDRLSVSGYDIFCPASEAETICRVLQEAGAHSARQEAFEILRIEAGTPVYGIDIDENVLAPEVARTEKAISYRKGCYLGQETIVRIRDLGHVNRSLVGLKVSGDTAVSRGSKLLRDSQEVGEVTSSAVSPRLETVIALGYVHRGCQEPGSRLEVITAEGSKAAEVCALPFVASSGD